MSSSGGCANAFGLWLLTDGRVLAHGCGGLNTWQILTPDKAGNYATGTWKAVASSAHARGGAQQHVLKDGRFFVGGGEYIDGPACTAALCNTAEIYDPVSNTWKNTANAPHDIGDTGSTTLADGTILESTRAGNQITIYDPTTDTWTAKASNTLGSGDENAWASLQNGDVLAVGYATSGAQIYIPSMDKWVKTTVPSGFDTGDMAGISQMFDGRVYVYGLNNKAYIWTPGASVTDPGSWTTTALITTNGATENEDEYTDTLPNGMVWGALVTVMYGQSVVLQQFDPTTNTATAVTGQPKETNPDPIDYLNLPNGQVMITVESGSHNWVLTPDGQPQDAWRPTVTSVVYNSAANNYTLTGTQISGLINGGDEGDDMTMAENYPIIWLKDSSNNVTYCKSSNFSNMMPSKGSTPETADFTLPSTITTGTYQLYVSAVGVISKNPFSFTVGQSTPARPGPAAAARAARRGLAAPPAARPAWPAAAARGERPGAAARRRREPAARRRRGPAAPRRPGPGARRRRGPVAPRRREPAAPRRPEPAAPRRPEPAARPARAAPPRRAARPAAVEPPAAKAGPRERPARRAVARARRRPAAVRTSPRCSASWPSASWALAAGGGRADAAMR